MWDVRCEEKIYKFCMLVYHFEFNLLFGYLFEGRKSEMKLITNCLLNAVAEQQQNGGGRICFISHSVSTFASNWFRNCEHATKKKLYWIMRVHLEQTSSARSTSILNCIIVIYLHVSTLVHDFYESIINSSSHQPSMALCFSANVCHSINAASFQCCVIPIKEKTMRAHHTWARPSMTYGPKCTTFEMKAIHQTPSFQKEKKKTLSMAHWCSS